MGLQISLSKSTSTQTAPRDMGIGTMYMNRMVELE